MTEKLQKPCACGTRVLRTSSSLNPHLGQISSQFAGFLIRSLRKSGPKLVRAGRFIAGPAVGRGRDVTGASGD